MLRKLSKGLFCLAVLVSVGILAVPGKATASGYIIKPRAEGGYDYYLKSAVQKGSYGAQYNQNPQITSYVPEQYYILVPTWVEQFSYQIRGGGLFPRDDSIADKRYRQPYDYLPSQVRNQGPGAWDTTLYELYGVPDAGGGIRGKPPSTIRSNDPRFDKAIDYSAGNSTRCRDKTVSPPNDSANCWVTIGPYPNNGPVWNDPRFPQYAGYRVYLLKVIAKDYGNPIYRNQNTGFVPRIAVLSTASQQPASNIPAACIVNGADYCADPGTYGFNPGFDATTLPDNNEDPNEPSASLAKGYFLRTTGPETIFTAPVNVAMGLQWGSGAGSDGKPDTRVSQDYEYYHGGGNGMGLVFRGRSRLKVNLFDPNRPIIQPPETISERIGNIDWDNDYWGGTDGGNPPSDTQPKAEVNGQSVSFSGGNNVFTSGNFWSAAGGTCDSQQSFDFTCFFDAREAWKFTWPNTGPIPDGQQATLTVKGVNGTNVIYFGGPAFGDGALPPTAPPCDYGGVDRSEGEGWQGFASPLYAYSYQLQFSPIGKSGRRCTYNTMPWPFGNNSLVLPSQNVQYSAGVPGNNATPLRYFSYTHVQTWNGSAWVDAPVTAAPGSGFVTPSPGVITSSANFNDTNSWAGYPGGVCQTTSTPFFPLRCVHTVTPRVDQFTPGTYRWTSCYATVNKRFNGQPSSTNNCAQNDPSAPGSDNRWFYFIVNGPPTAAPIDGLADGSPPNGARINYGCMARQGRVHTRVTDAPPVVSNVNGKYWIGWSGIPAGERNFFGFKESAWTGEPNLMTNSYASGTDISGNLATVPAGASILPGGGTVNAYLDAIPSGQDVQWGLWPVDNRFTADLYYDSTSGIPYRGIDIFFLGGWQGGTGLKAGNIPWRTFHKNTPPTFDGPGTTKRFYDLNGNQVTNVTDGQTIRVDTAIKNDGETPAKYYQINDYLGSVRDFEQPVANTFIIRKNNALPTPLNMTGRVKRVIVNSQGDPQANPDTLLPDPPEVLSNDDQRNGTWRMDYGDNQQANPLLPAGELAPGDTVTISYFVRANRNQNLVAPASDTDADYARALTPADTHIYVRYQENYCNDADRQQQAINPDTGDVVAPWLKAGRGDVHSNATIFGYDALPGDANATFIVTANGGISHFTSASTTPITNYSNPQAACTDKGERAGGIDWRREMIKNINQAKSGALGAVTAINTPSYYVGAVSGVYQTTGNLTITGGSVSGVGTIIVDGDLTITGNLSYAPPGASISSLGIIVLGNVTIDPAVTNIVGSYYVLDVAAKGTAALDAKNCPQISIANGKISTGASSAQLNVAGLMVAGSFDLQRYFTNSAATTSDPAENIYYDGRVVANTPPGFGTFRNTTAWYEIAP